MNKFIKASIYTISSLLLLTFVLTLFNYIGILSGILFIIFKILVDIFSISIGGYIIGINTNSKGWKCGLEYSGIILLVLSIINIILKTKLSISLIIFYILIIIITTLSSMFGIYKKIDK